MGHRVGFIGLVALVMGCDLLASDGPGSIGGSWGGVGASLIVHHDTTFLRDECISAIVPLPVRLSSDGSFLAEGTIAGEVFQGQSMRLYGAVRADTMHLYFQIQDAHGTWAAPTASLMIRGQAATDSPDGVLCIG
jgi:hypothetical protein